MQHTIYLVRHGDYDSLFYEIPTIETFNLPLSDKGKHDIYRLASKLKKEKGPFAKIIASPYSRTQETAGIIAKMLRLSVETSVELEEITHEEHQINDVESVYNRMTLVVSKNLNELIGSFIIVSHEKPIRVFMQRETGESFEKIKTDHTTWLPMGAAYKLTYEDKKLRDLEIFFDPSEEKIVNI